MRNAVCFFDIVQKDEYNNRKGMKIKNIYVAGALVFIALLFSQCLKEDDLLDENYNEVAVPSDIGKIQTLECISAKQNGILLSRRLAAVDVSTEIEYTGGNGGVYPGDTVYSTGVTGLTAISQAGRFSEGNGVLIFTISGIPDSDGTAIFTIEAGGISCNIHRQVLLPEGTISSLACDQATTRDLVNHAVLVTGVTCEVPYNGGNGGAHNGDTALSTGVTGLTAFLAPGIFADGSGVLTYTISGSPSSAGSAVFGLNIGGQTCSISVKVYGAQPAYPTGTVHCDNTPTMVFDVTSPATGKTWMDRNLGASRAATSMLDHEAFGDVYQWGRGADGHQCRTSTTTSTLSSSNQPGHGDFITSTSGNNMDWLTSQNDNLWQGVNGVNNPCPSGYRLPTTTELNAERLNWSTNNGFGAFNSPLAFTLGGGRMGTDGAFTGIFSQGGYWSSTTALTNVRGLSISNNDAGMTLPARASGNSVRCIKD